MIQTDLCASVLCGSIGRVLRRRAEELVKKELHLPPRTARSGFMVGDLARQSIGRGNLGGVGIREGVQGAGVIDELIIDLRRLERFFKASRASGLIVGSSPPLSTRNRVLIVPATVAGAGMRARKAGATTSRQWRSFMGKRKVVRSRCQMASAGARPPTPVLHYYKYNLFVSALQV